MLSPATDSRVVMTLDAGGTSFRFSARRSQQAVTDVVSMPTQGHDLSRCLANLIEGFTRIRTACPEPPAAISFAFPGPADYPAGIIGDLQNIPAFRGGVALGPMLAAHFGIPVFINNDGDLFTYGEAIAGLLPHINRQLEKSGSPRRYHNLIGLTLGTGFGAGLVRRGELFLGDNSMATEVWLFRHKLQPGMNVEQGISIRAVRRTYAEQAGIPLSASPEPRDISSIVRGEIAGNRPAAIEAFRRLGEITGDALALMLNLVDGLAVIGGGLSAAAPLFFPALLREMRDVYTTSDGSKIRRLVQQVYDLEDVDQYTAFLRDSVRRVAVPGTNRFISYDPYARIGVGLSRLGTSEAISIGAYAFALQQLDSRIS